MDGNDKLIKAISNYLPKLDAKKLRIVLLLAHEFVKISTTRLHRSCGKVLPDAIIPQIYPQGNTFLHKGGKILDRYEMIEQIGHRLEEASDTEVAEIYELIENELG